MKIYNGQGNVSDSIEEEVLLSQVLLVTQLLAAS